MIWLENKKNYSAGAIIHETYGNFSSNYVEPGIAQQDILIYSTVFAEKDLPKEFLAVLKDWLAETKVEPAIWRFVGPDNKPIKIDNLFK